MEPYKISKLLVVTKNQKEEDINQLIKMGYSSFGENRVQEAERKFQRINNRKKINLHLIGPLQSNKVKIALKTFNQIQTLDRIKLVDEITKYYNKESLTKFFYIQINIGLEEQKSGIKPDDSAYFLDYCKTNKLPVKGFMCIPPNNENVESYFKEMNSIKKKIDNNLLLSMGMSNDYQKALINESNLIRIGSLIFS